MTLGRTLSRLSKTELEELYGRIFLSDEEKEICTKLIKGYSQRRLCFDFSMSESTVQRRINEIKKKVGDDVKRTANGPVVPVADKFLLSPLEASAYFNIGEDKLREMSDSHNELIVKNGTHRLYKKRAVEQYLEKRFVI